MNKYRSAALALAACAASLAVAACSAGTPVAGSASTSTGAPSQSGFASAASSSVAAIPGRAIAVKGTVGSFPVPARARVVENMPGHQSFLLVFGLVTPADVSGFYATALPQAGFTITTNAMVHQGGDTGAYVVFTGHGLKGTINSLVQFPGYSVAGIGDRNVTTVVVTPAH
jgi:hypothetical protein